MTHEKDKNKMNFTEFQVRICDAFNRLAEFDKAVESGGVKEFLKDSEIINVSVFKDTRRTGTISIEDAGEAIRIATAEKQKEIDEWKSKAEHNIEVAYGITMEKEKLQEEIDMMKEKEIRGDRRIVELEHNLTVEKADKQKDIRELQIFLSNKEIEGNEFSEWCQLKGWKLVECTGSENLWANVPGGSPIKKTTSELRVIFNEWKKKQKGGGE